MSKWVSITENTTVVIEGKPIKKLNRGKNRKNDVIANKFSEKKIEYINKVYPVLENNWYKTIHKNTFLRGLHR